MFSQRSPLTGSLAQAMLTLEQINISTCGISNSMDVFGRALPTFTKLFSASPTKHVRMKQLLPKLFFSSSHMHSSLGGEAG